MSGNRIPGTEAPRYAIFSHAEDAERYASLIRPVLPTEGIPR